MIKLKCTCGATLKITQGLESDERRAAEVWLTQHKSCHTGVIDAELEARDKYITDLESDIAFYRSCINCGKTPADGDEPSARYAVVSPPTIGATEKGEESI